MEYNTPQLWDRLWEVEQYSVQKDIYRLKKEESSVRWQRMEKLILDRYKSFTGLDVIEIGAGVGMNAALMAQRGANITILDYSDVALQKSKELFERNGLKAVFIKENALDLPKSLYEKFDISMSFGLTEHFRGRNRIQINRSHVDVLRVGGTTIISVPNKYSPLYRLYKLFAELTGQWQFGEEYPYTRSDYAKIFEQLKVHDFQIFGDSFLWSLNYFNPVRIALKRILRQTEQYDVSTIKKEKGTPFDGHISYSLVLAARR